MIDIWHILLGTRPEIIKLSPLIRLAEKKGIEFRLVHTGQHYSYRMDRIFFEELELPEPDYKLEVGSGSHHEQVSKIVFRAGKYMLSDKPGYVIVEGDTNTTLGGALAAVKERVRVAHVESGCRSYNREMPEEVNRVIVDHLSDLLFAPTKNEVLNLKREGITKNVFISSSTGLEACSQHAKLAKKKSSILSELGVKKGAYAVATVHRAENTENRERLKGILEGLGMVSELVPVILPIHPRTEKFIKKHGLKKYLGHSVNVIEPLGYLDFLRLLSEAILVLTDSGGVQEEAAMLGVQCFTLRKETEWLYTLKDRRNVLVGWESEKIYSSVKQFLERKKSIHRGRQLREVPSQIIVSRLLEVLT